MPRHGCCCRFCRDCRCCRFRREGHAGWRRGRRTSAQERKLLGCCAPCGLLGLLMTVVPDGESDGWAEGRGWSKRRAGQVEVEEGLELVDDAGGLHLGPSGDAEEGAERGR